MATTPDMKYFLAPMEIGTLVSVALFGALTNQAYVYYGRFRRDSRPLKALVAFVLCGEIVAVCCSGHWLYVYTIPPTQYGIIVVSLRIGLLVSAFVGTCAQSFFAFRIYKFSGNLFIPCVCWLLAALRSIGSVGTLVVLARIPGYTSVIPQWGWLFDCGWAGAALNDIIIAGTLVYLLNRRRHGMQENPRTLAMIDKLIKWTLETSLLTSLVGIIMLVSFLKDWDRWIWFPWWMIQGRLYANSLLASLNSRKTLRAMDHPTLPIAFNSIPRHQSNDSQSSHLTAALREGAASTTKIGSVSGVGIPTLPPAYRHVGVSCEISR